MNRSRQLASLLLLFAFAGCSDSPQDKNGTETQQERTGAVSLDGTVKVEPPPARKPNNRTEKQQELSGPVPPDKAMQVEPPPARRPSVGPETWAPAETTAQHLSESFLSSADSALNLESWPLGKDIVLNDANAAAGDDLAAGSDVDANDLQAAGGNVVVGMGGPSAAGSDLDLSGLTGLGRRQQENLPSYVAAGGDLEARPAVGEMPSIQGGGDFGLPLPVSDLLPLKLQAAAESYRPVAENGFIRTASSSLSTFSIDVDTASYSNIRRFITEGQLPIKDAVRIEEMLNYFSYSYPQPEDRQPFSISTEIGPCPWNSGHKLVRIGLQAKDIAKSDLPPSNLVFLIDVSGSMGDIGKLPLIQQAMKLLVRQLNREDLVSIVVYAENDRVALAPTPGSEHGTIVRAITMLGAEGATHASKGLITAYRLAEQNFIPGGNNRVILASDGDFNVGLTSLEELKRLVGEKRKSGVGLTALGFGRGNYHDDTLEALADNGNGSYAYIDSLLEAKKALVKELAGSLHTIARDVKVQVEFNPAKISSYRLLGYENRVLASEDFDNVKKDAGDIGPGHTVTALYETAPAEAGGEPLKYQQPAPQAAGSAYANELMTIKLRFKPLNAEMPALIETVVNDTDTALDKTSADFRFAAAVAGFGMLLNGSAQAGNLTWNQVVNLAKGARGQDEEGLRAEFIHLVEAAELLAK